MYSMSRYAPSANVSELRESATIAVSTRAKALRAAGRPVIDLGAGEPDFPTPACVMEAAHRALDAGHTRYTAVEGIAPLRAVIAQRATILRGTPVDPADVVVSTGTKTGTLQRMFLAVRSGRRSTRANARMDELLPDAVPVTRDARWQSSDRVSGNSR
jgi:aspartate aminotransferase